MAVHLGGTRSPYMHGISIVALIRAALIPTHWRYALPTYTRIGLAFPLVMGLGAVFSPVYRAEWLSRDALIVFASNYVFVVTSSLLGMISGHIAWSAREQLYRARRLGRYRLQAPIGRGGMGEVWLAWDLSLQRNVALKILRATSTPTPELVKRFEREAQAAGRLRGPHIVRIFDYGASDDGLYYIAMEYLPGMDLATLVEQFGPMPTARAIRVSMQACQALEEAHSAGLIHRDLKPHNLFMTRIENDPDFVKLLDFGVVRMQAPHPGSENLTWTGVMVGTPQYVAPEVWQGSPADERSDIYSLGVTLHFLLSGATPFEGGWPAGGVDNAGSPGFTTPVLKVGASLDGELKKVVLRCLEPDPRDRFQSIRELWDALAAVPLPAPWTHADAESFWGVADRRRFG
jgi:serine/threonine-protein kinase